MEIIIKNDARIFFVGDEKEYDDIFDLPNRAFGKIKIDSLKSFIDKNIQDNEEIIKTESKKGLTMYEFKVK